MNLTFSAYDSTDLGQAYAIHDGNGKVQATLIVWDTAVIRYSRRRWSVVPARGGSDLDPAQLEMLETFAFARLKNGLEIDGVSVEV